MNCQLSPIVNRLRLTGGDNGRRALLVFDGTGGAAASFDGTDDLVRLSVTFWDLAEDDVLAIEPACDDGGDEELRAIAVDDVSEQLLVSYRRKCIRVWTSVGH